MFAGSLLFIRSGIQIGRGRPDAPPFDIDEAHKIAESYFYRLFFERRDFDNPLWTRDFYARTNPTLPKHIFGAVLAAAGQPVEGLELQQAFERLWRRPAELRKLVPDAQLRVTRRVSGLFGALVCLVFFFAAYRVQGVTAGLLCAGLVLLHPVFLRHARQGLTSTILQFHLALIVPTAFLAAGALQGFWNRSDGAGEGRAWVRVVGMAGVLPGTVIGLAAASKLNGALAGPAFALGLTAVATLHSRRQSLAGHAALCCLVVLTAALTATVWFLVLNPYYYHQPLAKAFATLALIRDWVLKQQIDPGGALFGIRQKLSLVGYFSLTAPHIPLQRALARVGCGAVANGVMSFGLALGLIRLAVLSAGRSRPAVPDEGGATPGTTKSRSACIALAWIAVVGLGATMWLPLHWSRYLLLPYLAISLTVGIGLAAVPDLLKRVWVSFSAGHRSPLSPGTGPAAPALQIAAACACVWILTKSSWLVDLSIVPPAYVGHEHKPQLQGIYAEAAERRPDCVIVRENFGRFLLEQGNASGAIEQFTAGLSALDQDAAANGSLEDRVRQYWLLYGLAQAQDAAGQRDAARRSLQAHIETAQRIREAMTSGDKKVLSETARTIALRQRQLDQLSRR